MQKKLKCPNFYLLIDRPLVYNKSYMNLEIVLMTKTWVLFFITHKVKWTFEAIWPWCLSRKFKHFFFCKVKTSILSKLSSRLESVFGDHNSIFIALYNLQGPIITTGYIASFLFVCLIWMVLKRNIDNEYLLIVEYIAVSIFLIDFHSKEYKV